MVRKQIYLTAEQAQKLRRTATREKRSEAEVIREALAARLGGVKVDERSYDADPLWGIVGLATGGPPDLSQRVDDYLYGDSSEFAEQRPPVVAREPTTPANTSRAKPRGRRRRR